MWVSQAVIRPGCFASREWYTTDTVPLCATADNRLTPYAQCRSTLLHAAPS